MLEFILVSLVVFYLGIFGVCIIFDFIVEIVGVEIIKVIIDIVECKKW